MGVALKALNSDYIEFLIRSAQSGRKNSFLELCEFNLEDVYTSCLRILVNEKISKSVAEEIFLSAWDNLMYVNEDTNYAQWLTGITAFAIIEELKSQSIRKTLTEEEKKIPISSDALENLIFSMDDFERLAFVLHDLHKVQLEEILELVEQISAEDLNTFLREARKKVLIEARFTNREKLESLLDNYDELLNSKDSNELEGILSLICDSHEIIQKLSQLFISLKDYSGSKNIPKEIMDNVSEELYNQSVKEYKVKKEKSDLRKAISQAKHTTLQNEKKEALRKTAVKLANEKKKQKVVYVAKTGVNFNHPLLYLLVLLIGGITYYYTLYQNNSPWLVEQSKGSYTVDGRLNVKEYNSQEKLNTSSESTVSLKIPNVGKIEIEERTEIISVTQTKKENRLLLNYGKINVHTGTSPKGLEIRSGKFEISDRGSNSNILIDVKGNLDIRVNRGFVEVKVDNNSIFLIYEHESFCKIGSLPDIPYNINSNRIIRRELVNYQYNDGGYDSILKLIENATELDAISMWHLLGRTVRDERELVLDWLIERFPLPPGVTRINILNLVQDDLIKYFEEIEWQI